MITTDLLQQQCRSYGVYREEDSKKCSRSLT